MEKRKKGLTNSELNDILESASEMKRIFFGLFLKEEKERKIKKLLTSNWLYDKVNELLKTTKHNKKLLKNFKKVLDRNGKLW